MIHRTDRLAGEIRAILGEALARQTVKDPRVRDAGIITISHVRLTGDLRQARVFFTVHGADDAALARAHAGLNRAATYLRRVLGDKLEAKVLPSLAFEIDRVFEQEAKIDALLRDVASPGHRDDPEPDS